MRKENVLSWLILAFLVWLGLTFSVQPAAPFAGDPIKHLNEVKRDFVDHYEQWQTECIAMSPTSPDYYSRVAEIWHKHEMYRRYRRIEGAIEQLARHKD